MTDEGNDTELIIDERIDFPESDRLVSVTVRLVPESSTYPQGVKYSMHYGTYDGEVIVRYDNAHPETQGHERHTPDGTEEIEFPGWQALLERFKMEVKNHEDWE